MIEFKLDDRYPKEELIKGIKTHCTDICDDGQCKMKQSGKIGKDHQKCNSLMCCSLCKRIDNNDEGIVCEVHPCLRTYY